MPHKCLMASAQKSHFEGFVGIKVLHFTSLILLDTIYYCDQYLTRNFVRSPNCTYFMQSNNWQTSSFILIYRYIIKVINLCNIFEFQHKYFVFVSWHGIYTNFNLCHFVFKHHKQLLQIKKIILRMLDSNRNIWFSGRKGLLETQTTNFPIDIFFCNVIGDFFCWWRLAQNFKRKSSQPRK